MKRSLLLVAILTLAQVGIVAPATDAQPALTSPPAASPLTDPLSTASPMDAGYRDMYNLDFGGGHVQPATDGQPVGRSALSVGDYCGGYS